MREPMMPRPRKPIRSAISTASWCFDAKSLTGMKPTRRLCRQPLWLAPCALPGIEADRRVAPRLARPAAVCARWRVAAALADQREGHLAKRLELAHDAIAAPVLA